MPSASPDCRLGDSGEGTGSGRDAERRCLTTGVEHRQKVAQRVSAGLRVGGSLAPEGRQIYRSGLNPSGVLGDRGPVWLRCAP